MTVENTPINSTAPAPAAPSVAAPVAAEGAATSTQTQIVTPTPVADAASVVGSNPSTAQEAVVEPKTPTTVLGRTKDDATPVAEVKPETPKEGEAPNAEGEQKEGGQSEEPATLLPYEDFTVPEGLPENFQFDEKIGEFKNDLLEFEKDTGIPRDKMQAFAQSMINRHAQTMQETLGRVHKSYTDIWEKNKSDWKKAAETDPEIGGNRWDTSVNASLQFIRTHGGSETQQNEFRDLMESTGLGNHPAMIRLLANANRGMSESGPLPGQKPAFQPQSKVSKRYGTV